MTPTHWRKVEDLFHAALSLPVSEREDWLNHACASDAGLLTTVRNMLAADHHSVDTGIHGAIQGAAISALGQELEPTPTRIGAYEVVRQLGAGGMGSVYLARRADDVYSKQVAIKLVNRAIAMPAALERFLQERQILASLDHPYIARLLDGGAAPDGRPYLILDYVEGKPITQFCAQNRLSIAGRCRLLMKVCEAVSYAHQNLIVHRDLKPGNILVTGDGTPKLLDFGIAKLLGGEAANRDPMTRAAYGLMTPEYASPEQVRAETVTVATDVYSLGAIFYEMLAGRPAHQFQTYSAAELLRVVCQQDVMRPSEAAKDGIPADLDNIVLKALEKDPRRRYSSAEQLADDIRRHVEHLPVLARHGSLLYRACKFAGRHSIPLAASMVITVTLAGTVVVSRRQATEAEPNRPLRRRFANAPRRRVALRKRRPIASGPAGASSSCGR